MNAPGGKAYRPWTPETYAHQAHAPAAKLPEDDLVFFLLDVVPKLDLAPIHAVYQDETRGAPPFDPAMMTCLLLYAYCVGVFSSRKIAQACERNLAFLAIVGADRPDFRTISLFRKVHLDAFADVFVQVLRLAQAAGLVRLGTIAVDGTKIQGNASRHKAMSYGYMTKEVGRLRAEIDALLKQAQDIDAEDDAALGARRGDELPEELRRRQDRLAVIEAAMKRLEAEAKAAADAERQRRAEDEAERQRAGTKRRGREPGPIVETPSDKAQTNFTDPELSIMKTANKGWEYCGNAQASVDGACQIILACDVTAECNDKQQAAPMAEATRARLDQAGIAPAGDETGARPLIPAALDTGWRWRLRVSIRTSQRSVSGIMWRCPLRPRSPRRRRQRPRSGCVRSWRRSRVVWCMRGGRRSSSGSLARSRRRGDFAGSCCAARPRSVANGAWCA